jgi:hypothetical protein
MLPTPIDTVLARWLPRVSAALGDELVTVLLTGSTVLQDLCVGWSDVDVCVVTRSGVQNGIVASLDAAHDEARDLLLAEPTWRSSQYLEGTYISRSLALRERSVDWSLVTGGTPGHHLQGDPLSAFDRYILSRSAIVLAGEATRFTPPTPQELAAQTHADLAGMWNYTSASGIWLCGMLHWLARTIVFWRDGHLMSKTDALRYEIVHGSPFRDAYKLSLQIRLAGSELAQGRRDEFLAHYRELMPKAQDVVSGYVRGAR